MLVLRKADQVGVFLRWQMGRFIPSCLYFLPVAASEKAMLHNVFDLESRVRVSNQNLLDEVTSRRHQILGQRNLTGACHLNDCLWRHRGEAIGRSLCETYVCHSNLHGLRSKRSESSDHLANKDSKAPNIDLVVIASADEYLGRGIGRRTTVGSRLIPLDISHLLGEAKVDQLDVARLVNQNIFWLQIPVDNVSFVQLLDSHQDLCKVKY